MPQGPRIMRRAQIMSRAHPVHTRIVPNVQEDAEGGTVAVWRVGGAIEVDETQLEWVLPSDVCPLLYQYSVCPSWRPMPRPVHTPILAMPARICSLLSKR